MGKAKDEPKIKQEPKEEAPKKNAVKDEPQKEEEEKTVKGQRRRPPTAMQRRVREWHDILTGVVEAEISVVIDDMEDYMNSTRRYEIKGEKRYSVSRSGYKHKKEPKKDVPVPKRRPKPKKEEPRKWPKEGPEGKKDEPNSETPAKRRAKRARAR